MFTHAFALLSFALAAVGSVFNPWHGSAEPVSDGPSAANPAAYAEIASTTPDRISAATTTGETNVPILVYHIVRPSYPNDSMAVRAIALTPESFDAELTYLGDAGYTIVGFGALEEHLAHNAPLPPHPLILSFDDGWANQYAYAFPILKKHGYTATFFVFTNAIGRSGFLTWDELKEMRAAGMAIGDHTRSHPYLTRIASRDKLWDEIFGSKMLLESRLGTPIREFAYPFGQHDATTTVLVREAGYASARGDYFTGAQTAGKLFVLSALNAPTTVAALARKLPSYK